MERIIDINGKKRRITIMAIPGILLLFVIGVLGYGFCIYNGYLLLNNPSKNSILCPALICPTIREK